MNVFLIEKTPAAAARSICNKHVVKMPTECAQMLCDVAPRKAPYRKSHPNHPCTRMAADDPLYWNWILLHGLALCQEYSFRYGKAHAALRVLQWCARYPRHDILSNVVVQPTFVQCMPDKYRGADPVAAYRRFYVAEKAYFAVWGPHRDPPTWFHTRQEET